MTIFDDKKTYFECLLSCKKKCQKCYVDIKTGERLKMALEKIYESMRKWARDKESKINASSRKQAIICSGWFFFSFFLSCWHSQKSQRVFELCFSPRIFFLNCDSFILRQDYWRRKYCEKNGRKKKNTRFCFERNWQFCCCCFELGFFFFFF